MEYSEKWGTDIDTAVNLALAELKATRDEVEVTVLEEPSRGFFGIGSKLALVRVERKKPEPQPEPEPEPVKEIPRKEIQKKDTAKKETVKESSKENRKTKHEKKSGRSDRSERSDREKPVHGTTSGSTLSEKLLEAALEEELSNLQPVEDHIALSFLREVTEQMGLDVEITARVSEKSVLVDIQGKDSGTIIGKRGQTLDAIQYLTSLVVNKGRHNYVRVIVDAENYRAKRERTLEKLANRLADKVIRTRKSVRLEPMNPYERKVIHATLQSNPRITTRSEGQDPYRRVIIELK